jgi:pyridoxamine 5'-phosphate oxidase family protein
LNVQVNETILRLSERQADLLCHGGLGRLATVSTDGQPHVVPVTYEFDGQYIYFGGWNLSRSLKYRNLLHNKKVAFVVDQVLSVSPWRVRGVEIKGVAEVLQEDGRSYVRISPRSASSWGL